MIVIEVRSIQTKAAAGTPTFFTTSRAQTVDSTTSDVAARLVSIRSRRASTFNAPMNMFCLRSTTI